MSEKKKNVRDYTLEDLELWLNFMGGAKSYIANNDDIVNAIQLNNTILLKILTKLEDISLNKSKESEEK